MTFHWALNIDFTKLAVEWFHDHFLNSTCNMELGDMWQGFLKNSVIVNSKYATWLFLKFGIQHGHK